MTNEDDIWADFRERKKANGGDADVDRLLDMMEGSLIAQESGGRQKVRNPRTNATGLFQVMPSNIPVWTKQYLGRSLTPEQFAGNADAQRSVFRGEMGKYLRKARQRTQNDDEAIRMASAAWYGGEGAMGRYNDGTRFRPDEPSFREYTTSILNHIKKGGRNAYSGGIEDIWADFQPNRANGQAQPVATPVNSSNDAADIWADFRPDEGDLPGIPSPTTTTTGANTQFVREPELPAMPQAAEPAPMPDAKSQLDALRAQFEEDLAAATLAGDTAKIAEIQDAIAKLGISQGETAAEDRARALLTPRDAAMPQIETLGGVIEEPLEQQPARQDFVPPPPPAVLPKTPPAQQQATSADYQNWLKDTGQTDSNETRTDWNENVLPALAKIEQETAAVNQPDIDAYNQSVDKYNKDIAAYNAKYGQQQQPQQEQDVGGSRQPRVLGKTSSGDMNTVMSEFQPPKSVKDAETAVRAALKDTGRFTPAEINKWVSAHKRHGIALLSGNYKPGATIQVPWYVYEEIKGEKAAETDKRLEEGKNYTSPEISNADPLIKPEHEAEKEIDKRIRERDYSLQQTLKESILGASGVVGYWMSSDEEREQMGISFNNLMSGNPRVSEKWAEIEKKRLLKEHGSYSKAWRNEQYYQGMPATETLLRMGAETSRSFVKSLVTGTAKTALLLDNLNETTWQAFVPDKNKVSLRNLGNGLDMIVRLMQGDSLEQAARDYRGSDDLLNTHFFRSIQAAEKTLGEDPILKERFLGSLSSGAGSMLSFVAMGGLMPAVNIGRVSMGMGIAGSMTMAGAGYEEGRESGLSETAAKGYGVWTGLLGLTEALGAGQKLVSAITSPTVKKNLVHGILEAATKGALKEAPEEFGQEVFQTVGGKAALEFLKESDKGLYERTINALNRLPEQIAGAVAEEGLVALILGGVMGGAGGSVQGVKDRRVSKENVADAKEMLEAMKDSIDEQTYEDAKTALGEIEAEKAPKKDETTQEANVPAQPAQVAAEPLVQAEQAQGDAPADVTGVRRTPLDQRIVPTLEQDAEGMDAMAPLRPETMAGAKERIKEVEAERDTERRRADAATIEANTNPLTGLGSKIAWQKAKPNIEADAGKAIISLDANNVKTANDLSSHDTVDKKVIARLGEVTKKVFEKHGLPIRDAFTPAGDELFVGVPVKQAEAIRDEIEKEFGTVDIVAERDYTNTRTGETFKKGDIVPVTLSGAFGQTVKDAEKGLGERKAASKAAVKRATVDADSVRDRPLQKIAEFKTEEGAFATYDFDKDHRGRADMFTVHKHSDGYIIRNAIVPKKWQRQGLATQLYRQINEESLKATGKPLRSTQPRTLSNGEVVHELTPDAVKLWDSFVQKGYAEKLGEKDYRFVGKAIESTTTRPSVKDILTKTLGFKYKEFQNDADVNRLTELYLEGKPADINILREYAKKHNMPVARANALIKAAKLELAARRESEASTDQPRKSASKAAVKRATVVTSSVPYTDVELKKVFKFKPDVQAIKNLFQGVGGINLPARIRDFEQRIEVAKENAKQGYDVQRSERRAEIAQEAVDAAKRHLADAAAGKAKTDASQSAIKPVTTKRQRIAALTADNRAFEIVNTLKTGEQNKELLDELLKIGKNYGVKQEDIEGLIEDARKQDETRKRRQRTENIVRETRSPKKIAHTGSETVVAIADGSKDYEARYEAREINDVFPSHNPQTFQPNPDYAFINDRHYDKEQQYQTQVDDRARNLKPNLLINDAPTVETGPPVTDADGNVLGGNSRSMIIARAYANHPDQSAAYKQQIVAKAAQFGLDADAIAKMDRPILVRVLLDESIDAQTAITDLNKTSTTDLTVKEQSIAEAGRLSDEAVDYITNKIELTGDEASLMDTLNRHGADIVNFLIEEKVFTPGMRNTLIDDGKITEDGKKRIERLLLGKVFADLDQFELVAPSIKNTLTRLISPLMKVNRDTEWTIAEPLREAIDLLNEAKAHGEAKFLEDYANRPSFIRPQGWTPESVGIAKALNEGMRKSSVIFKQYADDMRLAKYGSDALFDMGAKTQAEAFEDAFGVKPTAPLRQVADIADITDSLYTKSGDINYDQVKDVAGRVERGELEIVRLDRQGEQGRIEGGRRNVEASLILAADERAVQAASAKVRSRLDSHADTVKRQEKLIENYAKRNDIWFKPGHFPEHLYLGKGGEANVYRKDATRVAKTVDYRHIDKSLTLQKFLDNRISLFNHIFPEAPYELMGFMRDSDGKFRVIVTQPIVKGLEIYQQADVDTFMSARGLERSGYDAYSNALYQAHDLHMGNVLRDADGNIFVIDAVPKPTYELQPFEIVEGASAMDRVAGADDPDDSILKQVALPEEFPDGYLLPSDFDKNGEQTEASKRDIAADRKGVYEQGKAAGLIKTDKDGNEYAIAPNGERSNLNVGQWVEVRTKRFKNWFGDWPSRARLQAIDNSSIHIAGKSIDKETAERTYRALTSVVNANDGKTINFVNSMFGKIAGHKGKDLLFRVIPQLGRVVESSHPIYFEKESDPAKHSNIVGYRNYLNRVSIDGTDYYVRTTVQEKTNTRKGTKPQPSEFHSAFISDVEIIKAGSRSVSSGNSTPTTESLTSFDSKLTDFIKKSQDASKVVDENGEPMVVYHGTDADFDVFSDERKGFATLSESATRGFWFVNSPDIAGDYAYHAAHNAPFARIEREITEAEKRGDMVRSEALLDESEALDAKLRDQPEQGQNVMPVFLNIREMPEMDAKGELFTTTENDINDFIDASKNADGVLIKNLDDSPAFANREADHYLTFDRTNIKSAIGNRGTFDPNEDSILKSALATTNTSDLGFYSQVEKTIIDKMPNKASAQQIKGILSPNNGVKAAELEWLDLDSFLADNPKPTKEQIVDYIRANNVQVEEVVKGEGKFAAGWSIESPTLQTWFDQESRAFHELRQEADDDGEQIWVHYEDSGDGDGFQRHDWEYDIDSLKANIDVSESGFGSDRPDDTKFSQFTLPGGENYRELLLTMPERESAPQFFVTFGNGLTTKPTSRETAEKVLASLQGAFPNATIKEQSKAQNNAYKSSHFDEPNILAHVRFDERDGGKTLHISEMQSDALQLLRKLQAKLDRGEVLTTSERSDYDILSKWPFKKTWHEFAFKRMLRYAAENGYEKITWDTGETQADRYDLSKQVDSVVVGKNGDSYWFRATPIGERGTGENQIERDGLTANELSGAIGKELAERAVNEIGDKDGQRAYHDSDLKVGGEGMRGFYDKMLPSFVNKYTKKWGGKVEGGELVTDRTFPFENARIVENEDPGDGTNPFVVFAENTQKENREEFRGSFPTREAANEYIATLKGKPTPVHSLQITAAMRDAALAGQAMFQVATPERQAYLQDLRRAHPQDLLERADAVMAGEHLELNEEAGEITRRLMMDTFKGDAGRSFTGVLHTASSLRKLADAAIKAADRYVNKLGYTKKQAAVLRTLAAQFNDLAEKGKHGIAYVFEDALPEETHHKLVLDGGGISNKAVKQLKKSPLWKSRRFDNEYPAISDRNRAIEIAAKLETGQEAKYWPNKQIAAAKRSFLRTFAEDFIANNTIDGKLQLDPIKYERIIKYAEDGNTAGNESGAGTEQTGQRTPRSNERGRSESDREPDTQDGERTRDRDRRDQAGGDGNGVGTPVSLEPDGNKKLSQTPISAREKAGIPIEDRTYTAVTDASRVEYANTLLDKGVDDAVRWFNEQVADKQLHGGTTAVVGINLLNTLGKDGRINEMNEVADKLVPMVTSAAQTVQAMHLLSMFDPERAGAYAAKVAKQKAGKDLTKEQFDKAVKIAAEMQQAATEGAVTKEAFDKAQADLEKLTKDIASLESINTKISIDLDEALKTIRRLTRVPVTRKTAKVRELIAREDDILAAIAETYGIDPDVALKMVAWHGSPHVFDKFSTDNIGTGEGNQAYGYGLYFADQESVADHYRKTLTKFAPTYKGKRILDAYDGKPKADAIYRVAQAMLSGKKNPIKWALHEIETDIREMQVFGDKWKGVIADKKRIAIEIEHLNPDDFGAVDGGAKYRVDLKPAEDEYLLWDKPLSEQSDTVKKALEKTPVTVSQVSEGKHWTISRFSAKLDIYNRDGKYEVHGINKLGTFDTLPDAKSDATRLLSTVKVGENGNNIYQNLKRQFQSEKAASEYLLSLGIRGIKYLDGSSRSRGEGSYNYVIFADEDVEVQEVLKQVAPDNDTDIDIDPNLVDWATIYLSRNINKITPETFFAKLNALTANALTPEQLGTIHAEAVANLRRENPRTMAQKTAAQIRQAHIREAKKYQQAEVRRKATTKRDKLADRIIAHGTTPDSDVSPEVMMFALIREAQPDVERAIKVFKGKFPDISQSDLRKVMTDADSLIKAVKQDIKDEIVERKNGAKLAQDDIRLLDQHLKDKQKALRRLERDAARFYSSLAMTPVEIALEGLVNWRRASLLTGPKTHLRNIVSTGLHTAFEEVIRLPATAVDIAASKFTGRRSITGASPAAIYKSFNAIFKPDETLKAAGRDSGLTTAKNILMHGATFEEMERQQHVQSLVGEMLAEKTGIKAFEWIDTYIDTTFNSLSAEDALFKVYAFRRSLEDQAKVLGDTNLLKTPTAEMIALADEYAQFVTFTNPNQISDWLTSAKKANKYGKAAIEIIVPYDRTPTNIVLRAIDMTPAGFIRSAKAAKRIRHTMRTGEVSQSFRNKFAAPITRDMERTVKDWNELTPAEQAKQVENALKAAGIRYDQRIVSRSAGAATVGSAIFTMGYLLAASGLLTGIWAPDDDDREETKEFFERRKIGLENRSLKIGNYRFVLPDDPAMRVLTAGATMFEQSQRFRGDSTMSMLTGAGDAIATIAFDDQPLLRGVGDTYQNIKKGRYGQMVGNIAGGYVPTIAAEIGEVIDDKPRTASGYKKGENRKQFDENLAYQMRGLRNSFFRRVPIVRQYMADEATGTVSAEERGGPARRAVRQLIDIFNTRTAVKRPGQKERGFIETLTNYAEAIGTDPITAFDHIFAGEVIRKTENGTVIVDRMPLDASRKESAKQKASGKVDGGEPMRLDHTVPLQLGGTNDPSNLKLVPKSQWQKYTPIENLLGRELRKGNIDKDTALELMREFKAGNISASTVRKRVREKR